VRRWIDSVQDWSVEHLGEELQIVIPGYAIMVILSILRVAVTVLIGLAILGGWVALSR
jgi:hypothetical protein